MPLWAIGRYCKWSPWQKDSHGIKVSMTKRSPLQKLPRCKNLPIAQKGPHSKKILLQKGPHCKNVPMGNRLLLKVPIAKGPHCKNVTITKGPRSKNVPIAKVPNGKKVPKAKKSPLQNYLRCKIVLIAKWSSLQKCPH